MRVGSDNVVAPVSTRASLTVTRRIRSGESVPTCAFNTSLRFSIIASVSTRPIVSVSMIWTLSFAISPGGR